MYRRCFEDDEIVQVSVTDFEVVRDPPTISFAPTVTLALASTTPAFADASV